MAITYNDALATKLLDMQFNAGAGINFDSATLEIRASGGTPPANAQAAANGTVVSTITTPADAFAVAGSRSVAKSGTWQDTSADATGTADYFRLTAGSYVMQGSVGTSGTDMVVDSTSFTAGQSFTINSLTFSL